MKTRAAVRLLTLAAIAIAPAAMLHLIWHRGVNVPYGDDWALVPFVLEARAGTLSLTDLWAQHNEHRIVVPRLLIALLLPLTRFDLVKHMTAAWLLGVVGLAFYWRALRLTFTGEHDRLVALLTIAFAALLFTPVQFEAFLWALPAQQWQIASLCTAAAVWGLAKWPGRGPSVAIGAVCALGNALAVISGLALWVGVTSGAMLQPSSRGVRRRVEFGSIGVVALLAFLALYFADYRWPEHTAQLVAFDALQFLNFLCAYFGAALAVQYGLTGATVAGALLLLSSVIVIYLTISAPVTRAAGAPWIALWVAAFVTGVLTAAGRAQLGQGAGEALAPRYAMSAVTLTLALAALSANLWTHRTLAMNFAARGAAVTVVGFAALGYAGAYRHMRAGLEFHQQRLDVCRQEVVLYRTADPSAFRYLYKPEPGIVPKFAAQLEEHGLGPFAPFRTR